MAPETMQPCILASQYGPTSILCHNSAGYELTSSTPPDPASFNSNLANVRASDDLGWVSNGSFPQSNPSGPFLAQPATYQHYGPPVEATIEEPRSLRAMVACDACRSRKTKCNELRPRCSSCIENKSICSYATSKKQKSHGDLHERLDLLETMIGDLVVDNHRSFLPHKTHYQNNDWGSYCSPLEPRYQIHRYIDGYGGREDFIEVLSPDLLPCITKFVDLVHEQTSYQPPASLTAWQLKRSLHRYTMDPAMTSTDMTFSMMLEIDGILRAQARHNFSRLRACYAQDIIRRAVLALLALHLQKSIGKLGILTDFNVESDGSVVLITLFIVSEPIKLLHLIQDDSFEFELDFAEVYPSSWFPKASEPGTTPQSDEPHGSSVNEVDDIQVVESVDSQVVPESEKDHFRTVSKDDIRNIVEAIGGRGGDPCHLISRKYLWKYSLGLQYWSTRYLCNPQHLSKALTSINHCLRERLKRTLLTQANMLIVSNATEAFVQPVLDFLTLNIGTEVTRDTGYRVQRGHLQHITHRSSNMVGLHIQSFDGSWEILTEPVHEVPFLWRSNRFVMKVMERGIDLPLHWFDGH
jgi:hypothetical protein